MGRSVRIPGLERDEALSRIERVKDTHKQQVAHLMRERVNVADFESDHFAALLVERLGWAVSDAYQAEQGVSERS